MKTEYVLLQKFEEFEAEQSYWEMYYEMMRESEDEE